MRQINIDIQNVAGPMSRFYQFCVGGGRAYDTLVAAEPLFRNKSSVSVRMESLYFKEI